MAREEVGRRFLTRRLLARSAKLDEQFAQVVEVHRQLATVFRHVREVGRELLVFRCAKENAVSASSSLWSSTLTFARLFHVLARCER